MYIFQWLTIVFAVTCSALGDDGVNEVKEFVKDLQFDNRFLDTISVDTHEMELMYLWRYKNSSDTHLYLTLSSLRIDVYENENIQRCHMTLKSQPGMKILSSHVVVKALAENRTILQWMEIVGTDPLGLSNSSVLLKHLELDMSNCASKQTEIVADADESFFPAALNGTNILVEGSTFEILYPRKRFCGKRWCSIRFYSGLSLKSPEKSPFAYQPQKTLIAGGSLHSEHLWVQIDNDITELWLVNETSGSLVRDSTLPRKNERVTFAVGKTSAIWCTQDRSKLKESSCTVFFLPGNNTGVDFAKVDHGDELLWVMPSTVMGWDGLILVTLKRSSEGKCNIIVTKQFTPNDGAHKSKVIYRDQKCDNISKFEDARKKIKIFSYWYTYYCLSYLDHKGDIQVVTKCFDIRALSKE
ncbi:hypothetical protein QAD02_017925 [Eretmocerus hayati]|uniref:Uncharacterized protein n=1 Tax=Eretmocerus hayati TaxID=131215 RepID=A0ACC2PFB0_9HYME|nr:hypothetical protein QAD02_017925 [Eretmocerus hayati]